VARDRPKNDINAGSPERQPGAGPEIRLQAALVERLQEHASGLLASGAPIVLAGDYNVMPTDLDVYAPERWVDDALFRPEVREAFRRLTGQGWTDALRALHPNERIYSSGTRFARNAGLRIDHLLLSPPIAGRLLAAGIDRATRGREHASDHAPAWIEIADMKSGTRLGRRVVASAPSS
jgi:exodeoxyribonuclease-3